MKITSKHGNGNKVHIYIDDEYTLTLYDDYWYTSGICEGEEISEEKLAALKEEAGFRSAYEKAVSYLNRRPYSEKELFKKLKLKFPEEASQRAVGKVKDYGWLNDEEYADELVRYLYENKKFGIKRIKTELKLKGICDEITENALKTLDNNPIERIIVMLRSKYENGFDTEKEQRRFVNKLLRMGYSFTDIKSAFYECEIDFKNY